MSGWPRLPSFNAHRIVTSQFYRGWVLVATKAVISWSIEWAQSCPYLKQQIKLENWFQSGRHIYGLGHQDSHPANSPHSLRVCIWYVLELKTLLVLTVLNLPLLPLHITCCAIPTRGSQQLALESQPSESKTLWLYQDIAVMNRGP